MKSIKEHRGLRAAAFATATLVVLTSTATALAGSDRYRFEEIGPPSGDTLTVRLVDTSTGHAVGNAALFAIHAEHRAPKATPSVVYHHVALSPDGHGDYVYESQDVRAGGSITLAAQVEGRDSLVWGSVFVDP